MPEPLHPTVAQLRQEIARSDAVFCTPEYAGSLPGSFKNLLDWTVGANVLGYVGATVVEQACVRLPVARDAIGPGGLVAGAFSLRIHRNGCDP